MDGKHRAVKSYVLRSGRMGPGQASAYERLHDSYCCVYDENGSISPASGNRDFIIEIGFGMGDATYKIALVNPHRDYLGIEVYKPGIARLLQHIESEGIPNLKIMEHDAVQVLEKMIKVNSVDGFHIFFPDPWPKKKHHKRRIVQENFTALLSEKLKPGGYVYLVTDSCDYAEHILTVLSSESTLDNRYGSGFAEAQQWRPGTKFERKGKEKSHMIFEILFGKKEKRKT